MRTYIILNRENELELSALVEDYIAKGFVPIGGVAVGSYISSGTSYHYNFYQAMYKA